MSTDQFGLWLNNSRLFNQLNDDTLKSKQCEIISFFGGFREVINLCMKHQFNINLLKHQKLFQLLISFKTEQENKLYEQNQLNTELITEETIEIKESESKPLILLDLHDICISNIFTYLQQSEHFSLQKSCKSLTIIGRKKESFRINPIDHSYIDFGNYLQIEHKLSYIITHFQSNNIKHWDKAYNVFKTLSWTNKDSSKIKLINSGIIQTLFSLCNITNANNKNTNICQRILEHLFEIDSIPSRNAFIKHGIFKIIKTFIRDIEDNEDLIDICFDILNDFIRENSSRAILLNGINFFPILVENLDWFYERIDENLTTLYHILSAANFDWEKHDNILVLENMVNNLLYDWMDSIRAVFIQFEDEEDYESIPKISNSIVKIFDIINMNTNIQIKFQLNDSNLMSLILFLLKRTEENKIVNVIKQWLHMDVKLLFDDEICDFIMNNVNTECMVDIYFCLLSNIKQNEAILQIHMFERIRECLFSMYEESNVESIMIHYASTLMTILETHEKNDEIWHNIGVVYELFNYCDQLHLELETTKKENNLLVEIPILKRVEKIYIEYLCNNDKLLKILDKGLISNDVNKVIQCISIKLSMCNDVIWFVSKDNYKIFKQVIKACYSSTNIIPMKCCLKISKYFETCYRFEFILLLVKYDIIYAFQDFISYFKDKIKYSNVLCQVIDALNNYVTNGGGIVKKQLNLGLATKTSILSNVSTPKKVMEMVKKCDRVWKTM
eukprot:290668_1